MNRPKRPGPGSRPGRKPDAPRSNDRPKRDDRKSASPRKERDERGPARGAPKRDDRKGPPKRDDRKGPPKRDDRKAAPARDERTGPTARDERRPSARGPRGAKGLVTPKGPKREKSSDDRFEFDYDERPKGKPTKSAGPRRPAVMPTGAKAVGPRTARPAKRTRTERTYDPPSAEISKIPLVRGEWLYTTRAGYEVDVLEELELAHRGEGARVIAPSLIASPKEYVDCAFARQAMPAQTIVKAESALALDRAVTAALRERMQDHLDKKWALHVLFPDSEEGNKMARVADVLERTVPLQANALDVKWASQRLDSARLVRDAGGLLAQVCVLSATRAIISATPAVEAHSLHAGGRARMRVDSEAPSRAAMKLEEALDWFGAAPSRGDQCVDLGAAPGGWTHVLLARGAKVLAVDPGAMAPALAKNKNLEHIRGSAFEVEPESPVDWLFCDMVWRPLEVAAMLAKWGRRGWASMLVANIKLPMKQKAEFVKRVLEILREGGWYRVRARQLYHDREEVTVCAHRK